MGKAYHERWLMRMWGLVDAYFHAEHIAECATEDLLCKHLDMPNRVAVHRKHGCALINSGM